MTKPQSPNSTKPTKLQTLQGEHFEAVSGLGCVVLRPAHGHRKAGAVGVQGLFSSGLWV